jgi:hypothetical protein
MAKNVLSIDWDCFFNLDMLSCGSRLTCSWNCPDCAEVEKRPSLSKTARDISKPAWYFQDGRTPIDALRGLDLKEADFYVAECHADIWPILSRKDRIVNLDSHDDYGSFYWSDFSEDHWRKTVNCGGWAEAAECVKECTYYWGCPRGDRGGFIVGARNWKCWRYHKVFVCQSRPWTPDSFDDKFFAFLVVLAARIGYAPEFIGPDKSNLQRRFTRAFGKSDYEYVQGA